MDRIHIRISKDDKETLKLLCEKHKISLSAYVRACTLSPRLLEQLENMKGAELLNFLENEKDFIFPYST